MTYYHSETAVCLFDTMLTTSAHALLVAMVILLLCVLLEAMVTTFAVCLMGSYKTCFIFI